MTDKDGTPAATGIGQAPGRINLVGEHTDYNDGFVLPFAIEQHCVTRVQAHRQGSLVVRSRQTGSRVEVPLGDVRPGAAWIDGESGWAAYAAGALWALVDARLLPTAALAAIVELDSSVPIGAGLSSSAAIDSSVVAAADQLFGLGLAPREIAALATVAETQFVQAPTGGMDQLVSVLAERDHALFCDMRSLRTESILFDPSGNGLEILVIDSRAPHQLVAGEYRLRRQACEAAARQFGVPALRDVPDDDLPRRLGHLDDEVLRRRARHVITENTRVLQTVELLRDGRIREIGPLLNASHDSMRDDFEITVAEVDLAVQVLLDGGALGARMTGGGFGGCVIALVEEGTSAQLVAGVEEAYAARGFARPGHFLAHPSDGAAALR
ncbi:galactokinase [Frankineae bacterium MT45]|nr:galactokinase [Frankineae bacterium MT45]